jgi:hypothetical protein
MSTIMTMSTKARKLTTPINRKGEAPAKPIKI